ncbi:MAG: hypothetical protein ABIH03_10120, partial [Pseudomonadota bacterium]
GSGRVRHVAGAKKRCAIIVRSSIGVVTGESVAHGDQNHDPINGIRAGVTNRLKRDDWLWQYAVLEESKHGQGE